MLIKYLFGFCLLMVTVSVQAQVSITQKMVTFTDTAVKNMELRAIGKAIGNRRIVVLGEQDHGDAASMRAKAQLVQYLCEQKGFSVLLWEGDFFAFQQLKKTPGTDWVATARSITEPFWANSTATRSLWAFATNKAATPKPMRMDGFAMGFTSAYSKQQAPAFLEKLLSIQSISLSASPDRAWFVTVFGTLLSGQQTNYSDKEKTRFYQYCDQLADELGRKTFAPSYAEQAFVNNIKATAVYRWTRAYRSRQMARNADWLLKHLYPKEKVIIWTANYHAIKDYGRVIENDSVSSRFYRQAVDKDSVTTFTQQLISKGHRNLYSLVCISLSGTYTPRAWISTDHAVEPITFLPGTVEKRVDSATGSSVFCDLLSLPTHHPLQKAQPMIPYMHTRTLSAQWKNAFDGILFIKKQRGLKE
jgi:erythromycin esterase-like protein